MSLVPPPLHPQDSVGVVSLPQERGLPWWQYLKATRLQEQASMRPAMIELSSSDQVVAWLQLFRISRRFGARYFRRLSVLAVVCIFTLVVLMLNSLIRLLFTNISVLIVTFTVQLQIIAAPLVFIIVYVLRKAVAVNLSVERAISTLAVVRFDTVVAPRALRHAVPGSKYLTDAAAGQVADSIEAAMRILCTEDAVKVAGAIATSRVLNTFIGLLFSLETSICAVVFVKLGITPSRITSA